MTVMVGVANWGRRRCTRSRRERLSESERLIDKNATYVSYSSATHGSLRNTFNNDAYFTDISNQLTLTGQQRSKGGFADIHQAIWHRNGEEIKVAIKVLRVPHEDPNEIVFAKKRICREFTIWSKLKHDHILQLYGVAFGLDFIPDEMYGMVCMWAENGDLCHYLAHNDNLPLSHRLNLLRQISDALQYLHGNNVVHGDLTGVNILVDNEGNILLCDFGLSLIVGEEDNQLYETSSKQKLNIAWSAPEIVIPGNNVSQVRPTKFSDIYSFGSVMLQILTGQVPYDGQNIYQIAIYLSKRPHNEAHPRRPARPSFVSDELWIFMKQCWMSVPQERLCIEYVYKFLCKYE